MQCGRLKIPGFHNIIAHCRETGSTGGVGLFIKENINYKVRDDLSTFIPHVYESIFIEVVSTSSKNAIVGIIYRPNTQPKADIDVFSQTLYDTMDLINSERKLSVIMGDANIDLKTGIHQKTNDYIDNIFSRGFIPRICKPTRITRSSATVIDHIYTNYISNNTKSGIIITDVADHFGIFHIVQHKQKQSKTTDKIKKRLFTDTNISKLKQLLEETNFDQIVEINCPNEAFDKFMFFIHGCLLDYIPY